MSPGHLPVGYKLKTPGLGRNLLPPSDLAALCPTPALPCEDDRCKRGSLVLCDGGGEPEATFRLPGALGSVTHVTRGWGWALTGSFSLADENEAREGTLACPSVCSSTVLPGSSWTHGKKQEQDEGRRPLAVGGLQCGVLSLRCPRSPPQEEVRRPGYGEG